MNHLSMKSSILALGLYKGSGGPAKSVRSMARALNAKVISWVDPLQVANENLIWDDTLEVIGSRKLLLRQLLYASVSDTEAAESLFESSNLVSCHSFWRWHNLWLAKMSGKHGIPYWFVPHGGLDPFVFENQKLVKWSFLRLGGRRFIENASCVIFTANAERDKALRVCQPKRSEVIYWPLSDEDFSVERSLVCRTEVRELLGIPSGARCLLFLGRLHPMKRPLETIEAIATSGTDVHLILVGNEFGVSIQDCERKADELKVGNRVHVIGAVYGSEKEKYFSAADAYISLSRRENFNFTAAEAMAAGLPLILSPGNDLGGEIADSDCGWILPDESGESANACIRRLCEIGNERLHEMGDNGRAWASDNLRFDRFRERIKQLALEICG